MMIEYYKKDVCLQAVKLNFDVFNYTGLSASQSFVILPVDIDLNTGKVKDNIKTSKAKFEGFKDCDHFSVDARLTEYQILDDSQTAYIIDNGSPAGSYGNWTVRPGHIALPPGGSSYITAYRPPLTIRCECDIIENNIVVTAFNTVDWQWGHYLSDNEPHHFYVGHFAVVQGPNGPVWQCTHHSGDIKPSEYTSVKTLYLIPDALDYHEGLRALPSTCTLQTKGFNRSEILQWRDQIYKTYFSGSRSMRQYWNKMSLPLETFGGLTTKAIQDCRTVRINLPLYLKDLPTSGQDILDAIKAIQKIMKHKNFLNLKEQRRLLKEYQKQVRKATADKRKLANQRYYTLLKQLRKAEKEAKQIASTYLSTRYGTRLTVRDSYELIEQLQEYVKQMYPMLKNSYAKVAKRAFESIADSDCPPNVKTMSMARSVHIRYRDVDDKILSTFKKIYDLDVLPSLSEAWDWIPFSFLVNWFAPVGDLLNTVDAATMAQYLNVLAVSSGETKSIVFSILQFGTFVARDVRVTEYTRRITRELHPEVPNLGQGPTFLNHIPELTAILVQLT